MFSISSSSSAFCLLLIVKAILLFLFVLLFSLAHTDPIEQELCAWAGYFIWQICWIRTERKGIFLLTISRLFDTLFLLPVYVFFSKWTYEEKKGLLRSSTRFSSYVSDRITGNERERERKRGQQQFFLLLVSGFEDITWRRRKGKDAIRSNSDVNCCWIF